MIDENKFRIVKINNLNPQEKASMQAFSCGTIEQHKEINEYLHIDALEDTFLGITKTWLFFYENDLIGYFSLTSDRIRVIKSSKLNGKFKDGFLPKMREKQIPSIQIHHFAIDERYQKSQERYGERMMLYCLAFIKEAILSILGACLITVWSIKGSTGFYSKMGFEKTGDSRDQVNTSMAFYTADLYAEDE